ncbi:MAG: hypothetical protein GF308_01565 [Candidatus Heimdallarchaeota archaeon]|nr:hypothetical protein [Candidatus Heimdallarchaeota archaeon]
MTISLDYKESKAISELLIKVTHAKTFEILEETLEKIEEDFILIHSHDTNGYTASYLERFLVLLKQAHQILLRIDDKKQKPSIEERAVFGEMVALRDFCLQRLNIQK